MNPLLRPGHVVQLGDDGVNLGKVLHRVGDLLRVDGDGRSVGGKVDSVLGGNSIHFLTYTRPF